MVWMWALKCIVRHPPHGDPSAFVDAVLVDARGVRHTFIDKYAIFRADVVMGVADGAIRCVVLRAERMGDGSVAYVISTASPDGVCSAGALIEEFLVVREQLEWVGDHEPDELPAAD